MAVARSNISIDNGSVLSKDFEVHNDRLQSTFSAELSTEKLKTYEDIPGPKSYPIIRNLYKFFPPGSWAGLIGLDLLKAVQRDYGDIVRLDGFLGRNNAVFLFNPEHIEQVFRAESQFPMRIGMEVMHYYRTKLRPDFFKSAPGLFIAQGQDWYDFRTKINGPLMQKRTIKQYTDVLDDIAKDMVERLKRNRDNDNKITDLNEEINLWSMESIAYVALGTRIGCLEDGLDEDSPHKVMIESLKDLVTLTFKLDLQPSLWKLYPTPDFKKMISSYEKLLEITQFYINKALGKETDLYEYNDGEQSVLQKLLATDKNTAIVMAGDMLLAGVDTTSVTMMTTLYQLSLNQDIQEKLRTEIKEALANNVEKDRIPYLKACIKEATRIYPAVWSNARLLSKDIVVGGYVIPAQTDILFPNHYLAIHPNQYKDPLKFAPERWLKEDNDIKLDTTHTFSFLPFGFGARSCPGRKIAELELQVCLVRLLTTFRFEWKGPPIKTAVGLVNYYLPPYNFILTDI